MLKSHPLVMNSILFGMIAVIAVYDLLIFWEIGVNMWRKAYPVHTIHSLAVINSPIHVGETLKAVAVVSRTEECNAEAKRFIRSANDPDEVVWDSAAPGGAAGVGDHVRLTVNVDVPDRISPGQYLYNVEVTNNCDGFTYVAKSPRAPFEIIP